MKFALTATAALLALAAPAFAEGDAAKGEKAFKKCKSCHAIIDPEGTVIYKGGKTGPNLYGIIGAQAGSADFRYGKSIVEAGEAGLVWDQENIAAYMENPKGFLQDYLGDSGAKSKMSFKMRKGSEDVAAYLATFSPAPAEGEEATEENTEETTESN